MAERELEVVRRWVRQGTAHLVGEASALSDSELSHGSQLDGWSRKHLLAHVALNAEALGRLVNWARTGERCDMYLSAEQRDSDIQRHARLSAPSLRDWIVDSAAALDASWDELDDDQWSSPVVTAQGRTVLAYELPWLRCREVFIHAYDLRGSFPTAAAPTAFWSALVGDISAWRGTRGSDPALTLNATDTDESWSMAGEGSPMTVQAPVAALATWLSGRTPVDRAPALTRWL
jgi:maleylpyruvate isomerase